MDEPALRGNYYIAASGAAIGLAYGLSIRYGSRLFPNSSVFQVMTLSFMFFSSVRHGLHHHLHC